MNTLLLLVSVVPCVTAGESNVNATLLNYLNSIADYTAHLDLPTNSLRNNSGGSMSGSTDAIFVNGNLARVLLSTYELQPASKKNSEYKRQGLEWCDTFVELQAPIESAAGNAAGYWGTGYSGWTNCTPPLRGDCAHSGAIYFGDTGTAVTTLALCHRLSTSNASAQARYLATLEKYAAFVLEGSAHAPVNKKGQVDSFMNRETGAVGCGYYNCANRTSDDCARVPGPASLSCPSTHPYTIATATTGAAFFAELFNVTGNSTYAALATSAMQYEASVVLTTGEIPYILDGVNCTAATAHESCAALGGHAWPYDTISYVTEGVAAATLLLPQKSDALVQAFRPTVEFLVQTQNDDGFWGAMGAGDTLRSPRCLTLLSWWVAQVDTPTYRDKPVHEAIQKYLNFLLGPQGAPGGEYGVQHDSILTGMVGLAVADAIQFGISF